MVLIVLAVICLFPIFLVLINSFKENAEIVRNPLSLPDIIHLENYIQAWTTGKFAKGFLNSVKLTGCTVIIVLICATLAGYVLAGKRIKGSGAVLMYFMVAMTVPIQLFLFPLYYAYAKMNLIGNIPATSVISILVAAADTLSAARPGSRSETIENYIQRLEKLEEMAKSFDGVERVFAIQAGREIRIVVKPDQVDDVASHKIARDIKTKIENELTYPGHIKVTVIREIRASEIAK